MFRLPRWSPDGAYVAVGAGDGALSVFDSKTGRVAFELQQGSAAALPATSLRFRPSQDASKTKNVLVSCDAGGAIQHWHVTSGKLLHSFQEDNDNQVCELLLFVLRPRRAQDAPLVRCSLSGVRPRLPAGRRGVCDRRQGRDGARLRRGNESAERSPQERHGVRQRRHIGPQQPNLQCEVPPHRGAHHLERRLGQHSPSLGHARRPFGARAPP